VFPEALPVDAEPPVDEEAARDRAVGRTLVQTYTFGRCEVVGGGQRCTNEVDYPGAAKCRHHGAEPS
jgi:hypothetical protein